MKRCRGLEATAVDLILTLQQDSLSLSLVLTFLQSQNCFPVKIYQETGSTEELISNCLQSNALLYEIVRRRRWWRLTKGRRKVHGLRVGSVHPLCVDFVLPFHFHYFLLFPPLPFSWTQERKNIRFPFSKLITKYIGHL